MYSLICLNYNDLPKCVLLSKQKKESLTIKNNRPSFKTKDDTSTSTASTSSEFSSSTNLSHGNYRRDPTRAQAKPDNQRKMSSRPHDAPMKKRDIYFALDCEMVGIGRGGVDSALARVSIINWDNEIVLDTFVQVSDNVTDYRTYISGIRKEDIESISAMPLIEVRTVVQNILRGKVLIGHGLENDLKALGIKHPWCDMRDTAAYRPLMKEVLPGAFAPRKLRDLASDVLGLKIQEPGRAHNPVEDAMASMEIYKHERNTWESFNTEQVKVAAMLARQTFLS